MEAAPLTLRPTRTRIGERFGLPYFDGIVVAVTLERGGFGVDTAAPVAARILEHYFHLPITPTATTAKTQE
jgi:hypothetical protein